MLGIIMILLNLSVAEHSISRDLIAAGCLGYFLLRSNCVQVCDSTLTRSRARPGAESNEIMSSVLEAMMQRVCGRDTWDRRE